MNGTAIQIYMEDASVPDTFNLIGSQRESTITENTAAIDESNKESRNYVGSPGRYTCTVSCTALYVPTDEAFLALEAAMQDGTMLKIQRDFDASTKTNIDAICTSCVRNNPDQGAATVSADFQCSGAWSTPA